MFTSVDKALIALIMAVIYLIHNFTGFTVPFLDQATVTTIIGLLMPILVYVIPNKPTTK